MIRTIFLVSAVCVLSNCASNQSDPEPTKVDVSQLPIHCTREVPTGSHLPVTVCRSKAQIEQEKEQARALFRDLPAGRNDG
jgi:hypothetical protein